MFKTLTIAAGLMAAGITGASAGTLNISLDGYCNTFSLTTSAPFVYGTRGGCGYTVIDNGVSASVTRVPYTILGDQNDTSTTFTWYFSKAKKHHGNWYLYATDGTTETEQSSGTYTETTTAVQSGGKDVTARH